MHQVPSALIRRQKRNDHVPPTTQFALQFLAHLHQRKLTAQVRAQLRQTQPPRAQARAARRPVVVMIIHVRQFRRLELRVPHPETVPSFPCVCFCITHPVFVALADCMTSPGDLAPVDDLSSHLLFPRSQLPDAAGQYRHCGVLSPPAEIHRHLFTHEGGRII
jgi:hypothetical protein